MGITDSLRKHLQTFLRINEFSYADGGFDISRLLTYRGNAARNTILYNGDSYEIEQFFGQLINHSNSFWGAAQTKGLEIRKMHTGLPRLMVNTLANITIADLNDIEFEKSSDAEYWKDVSTENNFERLLKKATRDVLKVGDGAFKISFSDKISNNPIIEFYSGDAVDYIYQRGRVKEVIFYNKYNHDGKQYTLKETYGYGYITYSLYKGDDATATIDLNEIPETAGLENVIFDSSVILAVPYMIFESDTYKGRGQSIFDGKHDAFDALDEVVSQWNDAIRSGRVMTYIPQSLIPRNTDSGALLFPNAFDNKFIKIGDNLSEGASNQIEVRQPDIKVEAYNTTYCTYLDLCLQGIISPSTLGIDVKKLDNAESQREKEKTTLYTRQSIIDGLAPSIKSLIQAVFNARALQEHGIIEEIDFEVSFGEYANPSFEAQIEVLSNPSAPMSIESKVDELWGDSKSKEWKEEEVARIKTEHGILVVDEPTFTVDYSE